MAPAREDQDIVIQITRNFEMADVSPSKLVELAKTVCGRFGWPAKSQARYEVSIAIVDDAEIQQLNARFLNHKNTTDCLSFDLSDDGGTEGCYSGRPAIHSGQTGRGTSSVYSLCHLRSQSRFSRTGWTEPSMKQMLIV